jgi:hypothetical protein
MTKTNPMVERNNEIYNQMARLKSILLPQLNSAEILKKKANSKANAMLRLYLSKPDAFYDSSLVAKSNYQDLLFNKLSSEYDAACSTQFEAAHSFINWLG